MCCLTSPRTLRKAGTRCHLSSLNKHTSFPHVNFYLIHRLIQTLTHQLLYWRPQVSLPHVHAQVCRGGPGGGAHGERGPAHTPRFLTSFLHFRESRCLFSFASASLAGISRRRLSQPPFNFPSPLFFRVGKENGKKTFLSVTELREKGWVGKNWKLTVLIIIRSREKAQKGRKKIAIMRAKKARTGSSPLSPPRNPCHSRYSFSFSSPILITWRFFKHKNKFPTEIPFDIFNKNNY